MEKGVAQRKMSRKGEGSFPPCHLVSKGKQHFCDLLLGSSCMGYVQNLQRGGKIDSGHCWQGNRFPNDSFPFPFAQVQSMINARQAEMEAILDESKDREEFLEQVLCTPFGPY